MPIPLCSHNNKNDIWQRIFSRVKFFKSFGCASPICVPAMSWRCWRQAAARCNILWTIKFCSVLTNTASPSTPTFWSRHICCQMYTDSAASVYLDLFVRHSLLLIYRVSKTCSLDVPTSLLSSESFNSRNSWEVWKPSDITFYLHHREQGKLTKSHCISEPDAYPCSHPVLV